MLKTLGILLTLSVFLLGAKGCNDFDESDKIYIAENGQTAADSCLVRKQNPEDRICPMTDEYKGMYCVTASTFKKILKKISDCDNKWSENFFFDLKEAVLALPELGEL